MHLLLVAMHLLLVAMHLLLGAMHLLLTFMDESTSPKAVLQSGMNEPSTAGSFFEVILKCLFEPILSLWGRVLVF